MAAGNGQNEGRCVRSGRRQRLHSGDTLIDTTGLILLPLIMLELMLCVQLPDVRVLWPVGVMLEKCPPHHLSQPRVDRSVAAVHLAASK